MQQAPLGTKPKRGWTGLKEATRYILDLPPATMAALELVLSLISQHFLIDTQLNLFSILSNMASSSLESRLSALEAQLGVNYAITSKDNETTVKKEEKDLISRLGSLEGQFMSLTDSSFRQTWAENFKLMIELDPGSALTHQSLFAAPILYRKQELLASADTFKHDMEQVGDILKLLLIGQPPITDGDLKEEHVTQAPILTGTPCVSEEDQQRMDALQHQMVDMQTRTTAVADRMDRLLNNYHSLISTVSEKMILADEELRMREQS
jgi:hypothetical protein